MQLKLPAAREQSCSESPLRCSNAISSHLKVWSKMENSFVECPCNKVTHYWSSFSLHVAPPQWKRICSAFLRFSGKDNSDVNLRLDCWGKSKWWNIEVTANEIISTAQALPQDEQIKSLFLCVIQLKSAYFPERLSQIFLAQPWIKLSKRQLSTCFNKKKN